MTILAHCTDSINAASTGTRMMILSSSGSDKSIIPRSNSYRRATSKRMARVSPFVASSRRNETYGSRGRDVMTSKVRFPRIAVLFGDEQITTNNIATVRCGRAIFGNIGPAEPAAAATDRAAHVQARFSDCSAPSGGCRRFS
ncbi:hypothetical protein PBRA_002749 [Plasmodiophora brassicae]|uniref:Uncharacterized protein n=1 Tax=Plasmodiophora brassicae TaxID=37360 RepID=A0A0G4J5J2_PLABS|nr:hypothetical protein PBRA_002749 [Plasmodiophora brassicae]